MNVAVHPETFNILSLCTGGGGLDLGVELAMPSARTVCMVEREAFAASHLVCAMQQGLLDEAPVWSNARTFNGRPWRGLVDGLIGGIPCQPHSLAGKRLGEDDERDLWSTARRIIVQARPWFVLIENVRGMLSSGGAERVWRDFQRMGFTVEGGLFTASEVGAPHERERIIILAVADSTIIGEREPDNAERAIAWRDARQGIGRRSLRGINGPKLAHAECDGRRESPEDVCGRQSEPTIRSEAMDLTIGNSRSLLQSHDGIGAPNLFPPGPAELSRWRHTLDIAPQLEPAFRRVADGLASRLDIARVDRLRLLGNGVVSLEGAYALRTLCTRLAGRGHAGAKRLVRGMVMTDSETREAAE